MTGTTPTQRAKTLGKKAVYYPTAPLLGWTKTVETVVAGGPTANWALFAAVVTGVWVFAFVLYRRLKDTADDAADAAEDTLESAGGEQ